MAIIPGIDYTVVNFSQGKYEVDNNGLISRLVGGNDNFGRNMTMAQFEKKITDGLKSNSTQVSSDADNYRSDIDMVLSNDLDAAELLRYNNFGK